ncbi:MAG: hypothetical protein CM1200mP39_04250 [Dehalococcoidia bacterium]|nr:MAG: hypothetical protein CM1200mP39_04250 [Dehalococcoidia bacterium]
MPHNGNRSYDGATYSKTYELGQIVQSDQWLIKIFENRDYDALFATGTASGRHNQVPESDSER